MSETTGCITWHYVVLKASRYVCYRYYKWLFKSEQYINALQGTCNFIRDGQDLRFSNFSQVPLLVPPIEEQETVADYLDQKTMRSTRLLQKEEAIRRTCRIQKIADLRVRHRKEGGASECLEWADGTGTFPARKRSSKGINAASGCTF